MKKQSKPPQFSESIGAFCRMMEDAQKDYAWNYSEVNRMDRLTQDYLHKLELDGLDYKERAKVATSLAKCRQARREYKDTVEILEPLELDARGTGKDQKGREVHGNPHIHTTSFRTGGKQVNIVFWLIVIVALVLLWFCLSFAFKDESFNIPTSDGKTVRVNIEFSYRFDEARVSETFAMFKGKSGEAIKDSFIKPKVIAWTQEVSANYPVTDIFGDKRTEINAELDTYLREKFDQYGIIIDTVNFTDISVDEETAAAIQKKVTAQQELELANIEKQTAKIQAEKDREVAQINAEKAVIEAEAKAEALRIAAEAEAEANRMIAGSLTGELIEKIKYEQWNGELPTVTGSSSIISIEP